MDSDTSLPSFDTTLKKKKKKTGGRRSNAANGNASREEVAAAPGAVSGDNVQDTNGSSLSTADEGEGVQDKEKNNNKPIRKADETADYDYETLLHRAFTLLEAGQKQNSESTTEKAHKPKAPRPQAFMIGTTKTLWSNFPQLVKGIQRPAQHILTYVCIELGTTATLDSKGGLVIVGRFQPKQLHSLQRKYIDEYVVCVTCKSKDTNMAKENRLYFVQCNNCSSKRSVAALARGYVHKVKRTRV